MATGFIRSWSEPVFSLEGVKFVAAYGARMDIQRKRRNRVFLRTKIEKQNITAQEALKFERYVDALVSRNEFFVRSVNRSQGPKGFSISFAVEGDHKEIQKLAA